MAESCTTQFLDMAKALKESKSFPYPHLKAMFLAQCILECGRGITQLFALHKNPFGMHFHPFMNSFAVGVSYEACDGVDIYAKFGNWENVFTAYFAWFKNWEHYKDWELQTRDAYSFLSFIGPHYCPPGFTQSWKDAHGGLHYAEYIVKKLMPEAEQILANFKEEKPMPIKTDDTITWFEINRDNNGKGFVIGYMGSEAKYVHRMTTKKDLNAWTEQFPNANNLEVADTAKKVIPKLPDFGETKPLPPPLPFDKKWPPFMKRSKYDMPVRVTKDPTYFIIHWAASNYNSAADDVINWGVQQGYTFLSMGRDGKIVQAHPINGGGHHVGVASVDSFDCLGIEVVNVGVPQKVNGKWLPYYAQKEDGSWDMSKALPDNEIIVDSDNEADDESFAGVYQKFTKEQYASLLKLAVFMVQVWGIKYENIRGHDMVALKKGRKCDPGLALHPEGMVGFRKEVKSIIDSGKTWENLEEPKPLPDPVKKYSGVLSFEKGSDIQLSKNFHLSEWACKCSRCSTVVVDFNHVEKLQKLRDKLGRSISINSGYRCPAHNAEVGGVPNSEHVLGCATDIVVDGMGPAQVQDACEIFDGLGRYADFTHVDSRGYIARWNG